MTDHLLSVIRQRLSELGWNLECGSAIASKTYPTAVGPKTAFVYAYGIRDNTSTIRLVGDYYSEGRNVLSTDDVWVPKTADDTQARNFAELFSRQADRSVGDSYAARLHRLAA